MISRRKLMALFGGAAVAPLIPMRRLIIPEWTPTMDPLARVGHYIAPANGLHRYSVSLILDGEELLFDPVDADDIRLEFNGGAFDQIK